MKTQTKTLLAAALLALAAPAWAMNKCTGPDGKVSFQDAPCESAHKAENYDPHPASGRADAQAAQKAQASLDKMKNDSEMNAAIARGEPLIGMTRAQLDQAMGAPTKINADNIEGVRHDQIIYERPDATWYVYTTDGVVKSIQHNPGAPIGGGKRQTAQRCPTAHEIRDAEISAGSIKLSDEEKVQRQKEIAAMRACGR